jgi:hypothetical protein
MKFSKFVFAAAALSMAAFMPALPVYAQDSNNPEKMQNTDSGTQPLVTQFIRLEGKVRENELIILTDFMPFEVMANKSAPLTTNISSLIDLPRLGSEDNKTEVSGLNKTIEFRQGLGHVTAKLPCDSDGKPEVSVLISKTPNIISAGVNPNFAVLYMGKPVESANLGDASVRLSDPGSSCLYYANLPAEVTNISILNTEDRSIDLEKEGMQYIVITAQVMPVAGS